MVVSVEAVRPPTPEPASRSPREQALDLASPKQSTCAPSSFRRSAGTASSGAISASISHVAELGAHVLAQTLDGGHVTKVDAIHVQPLRPLDEVWERGKALGGIHRKPRRREHSRATPEQLEGGAEADFDACAGEEDDAAVQVGSLRALGPIQCGARRAELSVEVVQLARWCTSRMPAIAALMCPELLTHSTTPPALSSGAVAAPPVEAAASPTGDRSIASVRSGGAAASSSPTAPSGARGMLSDASSASSVLSRSFLMRVLSAQSRSKARWR
eukprot:scaffold7344_cov127-Isochrysis_galbana.AAC.5